MEQINYEDPKYPILASNILGRHNRGEAEANITSAIRDFLIQTGLANPNEIVEESPSSDSSRTAVDLTALDTFIEVKKRIGNGLDPNPRYLQQLDDYLSDSLRGDKGVRTGILTDGKYWLLRLPNAKELKTSEPYGFTLENAHGWIPLHDWLRDKALVSLEDLNPDRSTIKTYLGPDSIQYERDIAALNALYQRNAHLETIRVKRDLWHDLLHTALGEVARDISAMDDLFVRHTYLTAVVGMVVQAYFGIDIRRIAEQDTGDLLVGTAFRNQTGLQGVVESDFFTWPNEVGGAPSLKTLANLVARFEWSRAPADIAAILYEEVIGAEERRRLGEYYTPAWLARAMVREVVTDPLNQHVLDPSCGSGTFVAEAVQHHINEANKTALDPIEKLNSVRAHVTGIDVHPVAVHLARAAWVLAAQPVIQAAYDSGAVNVTAPIYLGDALQVRRRTGDLFDRGDVMIDVKDDDKTLLSFPASLVEEPEEFDALVGRVTAAIERGESPNLALRLWKGGDKEDRDTLRNTVASLQTLHEKGRDHIWAYYTRNVARPAALARSKVDVIVGNPPWLTYNRTASTFREALEIQGRETYGIRPGGHYTTHHDIAGLFYTRCVDLYLKPGGIIGMVMPHSALQAGQYASWRSGHWKAVREGAILSVDFTFKVAWDLEQLQPNSFFPVPASVVFAQRADAVTPARPLDGGVERWRGPTGSSMVTRVTEAIAGSSGGTSPYGNYALQGAVIVPRRLFFVEETENTALIQAGGTVTVNPRFSKQEKEPWKSLPVPAISHQTVEAKYLFDVYLGETLVPYATLEPLKALLPMDRENGLLIAHPSPSGSGANGMEEWMGQRWQSVSELWEQNKAPTNKLSLLEQLDYYGKLSAQIDWWRDPIDRPKRVIYSTSGQPTAALLAEDDAIVDTRLYWLTCKHTDEANYLLAIVNSVALRTAVVPFMSKGQFGARDLHKHLWRLPIPEYDGSNPLHVGVSKAGEASAAGVAVRLKELRKSRGDGLTCAIARKELRGWLGKSDEGKAVEEAVGRLLGGSGTG